jgi:hypothetical protein
VKKQDNNKTYSMNIILFYNLCLLLLGRYTYFGRRTSAVRSYIQNGTRSLGIPFRACITVVKWVLAESSVTVASDGECR